MTEGVLVDRLDQTVDAILTRRDATVALRDEELAPLARVAADLRHYPSQEFKARLRAALERKAIRDSIATITPYLRVKEPGLVDFLGRVFGAVETGHTPMGREQIDREVRIGDSMIVIGEGGTEGIVSCGTGEFHVYVEDVDAAFQRALAAGATSLGDPADRPYGERAGFVRDAFGNHWFIATHLGGSYLPEELRTLTPFVHARGALQYLEFLKRAFGAVEEGRHEIGGLIRYARLRIGNAAFELGEAETSVEPMPAAFYLHADDVDALYEQAVGAGARPLSPPVQTIGTRVASVEDPAGNRWLLTRPVG